MTDDDRARLNFVRLPALGGAEVIIQSERPLPSAAWLVEAVLRRIREFEARP